MPSTYTLPDWDLLLKAVAASPDDDLPRLVAADWLDEHGEPERGEFIRVQVERAKADRPELELREKALLNNPLLGPIWAVEACPNVVSLEFGSSVRSVGVSGAERVTFRRGFPFRIACTADEWLRHGGGIIPRQPVRELVLTNCDDLDRPLWWSMAGILRPLARLEIDTAMPTFAAWVRDYLCPGVRVVTSDRPFDDEIIADGLIPPPFRRPSLPTPLSGPEDLPGRNDIPF